MLVLKCLADETGDDAGAIVARGFLDVDDREFANIVNRLEGYFDCTLWLRSRSERRFLVDELVGLVSAATAGAGSGAGAGTGVGAGVGAGAASEADRA
ncbi:DUF6137 domain-containing protein [Streptomyces sp. NPDC040724]|uniref:DUF6137 domain-containing protein n=1 Tax=Streptomyces sp. NPDC040724 TaxID=3155612 RepID=UPI0033E7D5DC